MGEARHHLERVAQDHAVRPGHVVLIELHRLGVIAAADRQTGRAPRPPAPAPAGSPAWRCAHAYAAPPARPRTTASRACRSIPAMARAAAAHSPEIRLLGRQRPLSRDRQQLREAVRLGGIRGRPQDGRQMRVVFIANPRRFLQDALRLQPRRRNVLPLGGIFDRRDRVTGDLRAGFCGFFACHGTCSINDSGDGTGRREREAEPECGPAHQFAHPPAVRYHISRRCCDSACASHGCASDFAHPTIEPSAPSAARRLTVPHRGSYIAI